MKDFKVIANGLSFPEGPVLLPDGSIALVEIAKGRLTRVDKTGQLSVIAEVGGGPNGAALGPDGLLYVCNNGGFRWTEEEAGLRPIGQALDYVGGSIQRVHPVTGALEVLCTSADSIPLSAPNDIVFDQSGGFWFTDTGAGRHRDLDRGRVCYVEAGSKVAREVIFPMLQPNGVGLSPDGNVLYVAETVTGRLWSFDLARPGEVRRGSGPAAHGGKLLITMPNFQLLDSLALEANGNVAVASIYKGAIVVISPAGQIVQEVPLMDKFVTNICFGGADRRTAYVTLSQSGQLIALNWHRSGLALNFESASVA